MQSDVIFSAKLGSLRKGFKKEIDFTFIRAPHKVPSNNEENADKNGLCCTSKKYLIYNQLQNFLYHYLRII